MAASYPSAIKTFATRSNGQTIDASQVNDLQDEVNAIEAGLLNGTAPLTSSNATVAALSVLGPSTFVGGVTFSSGGVTSTVTFFKQATFSSGITVSGAAGLLVTGPVLFQGNVQVGLNSVVLSTGETTALSLSTATCWLVSSTGASTGIISTISGIARGNQAGDILLLNNNGNATWNIQHAGSSAASSARIVTPNGLTISVQIHEGVGLFYDGSNWRVFSMAQST